jgi:hypothetical protein
VTCPFVPSNAGRVLVLPRPMSPYWEDQNIMHGLRFSVFDPKRT